MQEQFFLFLSNQLERLFTLFKEELYSHSFPLSKRLVIVESPLMRAWLYSKLAQDIELRVACGIDVISLNLALGILLKKIGCPERSRFLLKRETLALKLEKEIRSLIDEGDLELRKFLGIEELLSDKHLRRVTLLSDELSHLFEKWGVYGDKKNKAPYHWQEKLWDRVYGDGVNLPQASVFDLPKEVFNQSIPHFQIHVFALSHVAPLYFRFLQNLSKACPVHFYHLSPCLKFWSDIKKEKDVNYILKKEGKEELRDLFLDHNSLLANWGKLAKEMSVQIEESDTYSKKEEYIVSHGCKTQVEYQELLTFDEEFDNRDLTLLSALQADLALMRNPRTSPPISLKKEDRSIELHIAPSKYREVEILYHTILRLIEHTASEKDPINPNEIVVMAPTISEYEPYIRWIFGRGESILDFQIFDLSYSQNPFIGSFLKLIALAKSRFDAKALMDLFESPYFQRKHNLTNEDIEKVKDWIRESSIRWGLTPQQREKIFQKDYFQENLHFPSKDISFGTWESGIDRLISSLVFSNRCENERRLLSQSLPLSPMNVLQSSTDLFNTFIEIIEMLKMDLATLAEKKMTVVDFVKEMRNLNERYFELSEKRQDEEYKIQFLNVLKRLEEIGQGVQDELISWDTFEYHLKKLFEKRDAQGENRLGTIAFASLLPMRSIPFQAVFLLGMQEEFPRPVNKNLLDPHPIFAPNSLELDRSLFLEACLSARRFFVMSYVSQSPTENQGERLPSTLVAELLDYLDSAFSLEGRKPSECIVKKHPFNSYDKSYFQGGDLKSYSRNDFALAKSLSIQSKEKARAFDYPEFDPERVPESIDIKELLKFSSHPIRYYLQNELKIYLQDEDSKMLKSEEGFSLSPFTKWMIQKASLEEDVDLVIEDFSKMGHMPPGLLGKAEKMKLTKEMTDFKKRLKTFGDLFDIEMSEGCREPHQISMDCIQIPAPLIEVFQGITVRIVGKMGPFSSLGIFHLERKCKRELIFKRWPAHLLLGYIPESIVKREAIFLEDAKDLSLESLDRDAAMKHYLQLFFRAQKGAPLLHANWIKKLLEKNYEAFCQEVQNDFYLDPYLEWVFSTSHYLEEKRFDFWKNSCIETFEKTASKWKLI